MVSGRRLAFAILTAAVSAAVLVAACGLDVTGPERVVEGGLDARPDASLPVAVDAELPVDASVDVNDAASPPCGTGLRGPEMVPVPDAGYCIDSTEVTGAQYSEFLVAIGGGADASFLDASTFDGGLPAFCVRDGFAPNGKLGTEAGPPTEPVTAVNWCDAYAYCQWSGKRLCSGRSQLDAGPRGEWLNACTRGGDLTIPVGDAAACNVGTSKAAPPQAYPLCEGGYSGLFDMLGNVEEWVDDCNVNGCALYGAYWGTTLPVSCASVERLSPNAYYQGFGFRCCR